MRDPQDKFGPSQLLPALAGRDFGYRGPSPQQPTSTGQDPSCCGGRRAKGGPNRSWLDHTHLPPPSWPRWQTFEGHGKGDGDKDWDPKKEEPWGGKGKQQKPPWDEDEEHHEAHLQTLYRDVTPNCDLTQPGIMNFRTGFWYGESVPGGVIVHSLSFFQFAPVPVAGARLRVGVYAPMVPTDTASVGLAIEAFRGYGDDEPCRGLALTDRAQWSRVGGWQLTVEPERIYERTFEIPDETVRGRDSVVVRMLPEQLHAEEARQINLSFSVWLDVG